MHYSLLKGLQAQDIFISSGKINLTQPPDHWAFLKVNDSFGGAESALVSGSIHLHTKPHFIPIQVYQSNKWIGSNIKHNILSKLKEIHAISLSTN